jgi:hypothetical protein
MGSVISTVASTLYTRSLHRAQAGVSTTRQRIQQRRTAVTTAVTTEAGETRIEIDEDPMGSTELISPGGSTVTVPAVTPDPAGATEASAGVSGTPTISRTSGRMRWSAMLAAAVAMFLVAVIAISVLEKAIGHPVSGTTTDTEGGTTVGRILGGGGSTDPSPSDGLPTSEATPSATDPTAVASPSETFGGQASPTSGAPSPTDTGSTIPSATDTASPAAG